MNIKKIALKVANELDDKHELGERTRSIWPVAFAEALVAELAKENEPVGFAEVESLRAEIDSLRKDAARLQQIAFLIGNIFAHGNFVAETFNERELEKLLRKNGTFWESLEDFESQMYPAIAAAPKEK